MWVLIDENIPLVTVRKLLDRGWDVKDLRGSALQGAPDQLVAELAEREDRLLITTDAGFLERLLPGGLLVVRLKRPNAGRIDSAVERGLAKIGGERGWRSTAVEGRSLRSACVGGRASMADRRRD